MNIGHKKKNQRFKTRRTKNHDCDHNSDSMRDCVGCGDTQRGTGSMKLPPEMNLLFVAGMVIGVVIMTYVLI